MTAATRPPTPTILACTDGSAYARSLYQHTAWTAQRLHARVEVLHVLDHERDRVPHLDLSGAIGVDAGAHLTEELARADEAYGSAERLRGKAILEDAVHQLAAAGITDVTATQRHGALVETLAELEPRVDLVVIGKRGTRAGSAKEHLGANLERVVRTAVRPVLVTSSSFQPIERFLIAFDGGRSVAKAIEFALARPLLKGLGCHILRAGHLDANAKWFLEEAAAKLRSGGYEVTPHAIDGPPERVIADVIQRERIQLLVMGAYGHSPVRSLILGSTTTDMVRTCQVPVLMFR
jgi:nucleotide-binding universal stress UspA family protein